VVNSAPEAELVKVLSYEERFGEDSRGVFIVAGQANGSPLTTSSRSSLLMGIRDRVPLDCKIYLTPPTILPIEVVLGITWNPNNTTTFTDTLASNLNQTLADLVNPIALGLGTPLSYTDISRLILSQSDIVEILVLDVKERIILDSGSDTSCGRFAGEGIDDEVCLYEYNTVVSKSSQGTLTPTDPTSAYRLYKATISLTSTIDYSTLTYTYDNQYDLP
jgi:hypothetical protein